jgi:hypothetical protein
MSRALKGKRVLVVVAWIATACALPNCFHVDDPPLPDDLGGAGGKSSAGGSAGTTGGSSGSAGRGGGGSSAGNGGSAVNVGSGGTAGAGGTTAGGGGAGGSGGTAPDAGGDSGGNGPMCGKVTLMTDDPGHISSNLSDLLDLINGPNAATEPYPLAPTGGGGHTHLISFTEAQVMTLRNGGSVTVKSSTTENHSHQVTVSCTKK